MKQLDITFTVDENGTPYFKVRYHDKSNELTEKMLGVFLRKAMKAGIHMERTGSYATTGCGESSQDYDIKLNVS